MWLSKIQKKKNVQGYTGREFQQWFLNDITTDII